VTGLWWRDGEKLSVVATDRPSPVTAEHRSMLQTGRDATTLSPTAAGKLEHRSGSGPRATAGNDRRTAASGDIFFFLLLAVCATAGQTAV
jgi:hypothetical protein